MRLDVMLRQFLVDQGRFGLLDSGNIGGSNAQLLQTVINGFGGSSGSQHQSLLMMGFQKRFQGVFKPDDVRIKSGQLFDFPFAAFDFNHVDRAD